MLTGYNCIVISRREMWGENRLSKNILWENWDFFKKIKDAWSCWMLVFIFLSRQWVLKCWLLILSITMLWSFSSSVYYNENMALPFWGWFAPLGREIRTKFTLCLQRVRGGDSRSKEQLAVIHVQVRTCSVDRSLHLNIQKKGLHNHAKFGFYQLPFCRGFTILPKEYPHQFIVQILNRF